MKRQIVVWLLATFLVTIVFLAEAQQPKKIFRIGYLSPLSPSSDNRAEPFRLALRALGFIEGKNIAIEYRHTEGKPDRLAELAAELVSLKVDIIVAAGGDSVVQAAKNATKTIPIVMMGQGVDPVAAGLVDSLARPGGNVTGITNLSRELGGKRLELLKQAVGKVTGVAVLYDPAQQGVVRELKEYLPPAARALKLTIQPWEVRGADDFDRVFAAMTKQRPHGLYAAISGGMMVANVKRIAGFALKNRLPSVGTKDFVDAGGLMYYGADATDSYRQVAWYVERILKGSKPAELPVQQPMKFEFVINLQTAKQIGVTINTDLLARATKIIR